MPDRNLWVCVDHYHNARGQMDGNRNDEHLLGYWTRSADFWKHTVLTELFLMDDGSRRAVLENLPQKIEQVRGIPGMAEMIHSDMFILGNETSQTLSRKVKYHEYWAKEFEKELTLLKEKGNRLAYPEMIKRMGTNKEKHTAFMVSTRRELVFILGCGMYTRRGDKSKNKKNESVLVRLNSATFLKLLVDLVMRVV